MQVFILFFLLVTKVQKGPNRGPSTAKQLPKFSNMLTGIVTQLLTYYIHMA
jgi:hypothetical protein